MYIHTYIIIPLHVSVRVKAMGATNNGGFLGSGGSGGRLRTIAGDVEGSHRGTDGWHSAHTPRVAALDRVREGLLEVEKTRGGEIQRATNSRGSTGERDRPILPHLGISPCSRKLVHLPWVCALPVLLRTK